MIIAACIVVVRKAAFRFGLFVKYAFPNDCGNDLNEGVKVLPFAHQTERLYSVTEEKGKVNLTVRLSC